MQAMLEKPAIVLVPIGAVAVNLLDALVVPLTRTFGLPCEIAAPVPVPLVAYDPLRGQYVGDHILQALMQLDIPRPERLLGIVDADCYTPGLNFVFGQARRHAREALIALPRLRQSSYHQPEDEALFQARALKEAVHELGHTYGLGHCPNSRCVMHFSNSLQDTDRKGSGFCSRCRSQLALVC
jgi:archaemetzincin